jgi:hypothetical protein
MVTLVLGKRVSVAGDSMLTLKMKISKLHRMREQGSQVIGKDLEEFCCGKP